MKNHHIINIIWIFKEIGDIMKDYKKILKNEDVVIKSIDNLKNEDFNKDVIPNLKKIEKNWNIWYFLKKN